MLLLLVASNYNLPVYIYVGKKKAVKCEGRGRGVELKEVLSF